MKLLFVSLLVCATGGLVASDAAGQSRRPAGETTTQSGTSDKRDEQVRRPYRGLFAPPKDEDKRESLVFSGSAYAAYGSYRGRSGQTGGQPTLSPQAGPAGYFLGGQSALDYQYDGNNTSFQMNGGGELRYFTTQRDLVPMYHEDAALSRTLGQRAHLNVAQQFLYTPMFRFNLFPGGGNADNPDLGFETNSDLDLFKRRAYRNAAEVNLSEGLTSRSTLQLGYGVRYVNFVEPQFRDLLMQHASIGVQKRLTAHTTLDLGYRYGRATFQPGDIPPQQFHNINAGVNYSRALSFSRRTTFSFSTGSAIVQSRRTSADQLSAHSHLRLLGDAQLTHEFGRTWTATGEYHRGLMFREGFDALFYTDSALFSLDGYFSRRVDLTVDARYVHATLRSDQRPAYDATVFATQLRYALSRTLALFGRYSYYQGNFAHDISATSLSIPNAHRQSVRVGVMTSIPLMR